MAVNFKIVEDNTAPDYVITCTRDGTAIDLTTASAVTLIIQNKSTKTITQAGKTATLTTPSSGIITYRADATDFPSRGKYVADVKVTWTTGTEILYGQATWQVRAKIA